jgi:hypothetical protein
MFIAYLPPTSHLQSYNLPTNPPTYLDVILTYPPTYLDVLLTYLHIYILPTFLPTCLPTTYFRTSPPTYPPTYLLQPTYLPIS